MKNYPKPKISPRERLKQTRMPAVLHHKYQTYMMFGILYKFNPFGRTDKESRSIRRIKVLTKSVQKLKLNLTFRHFFGGGKNKYIR